MVVVARCGNQARQVSDKATHLHVIHVVLNIASVLELKQAFHLFVDSVGLIVGPVEGLARARGNLVLLLVAAGPHHSGRSAGASEWIAGRCSCSACSSRR